MAAFELTKGMTPDEAADAIAKDGKERRAAGKGGPGRPRCPVYVDIAKPMLAAILKIRGRGAALADSASEDPVEVKRVLKAYAAELRTTATFFTELAASL